MQIVDNAIILLLIALSFFAGKRTADRYNEHIIDELRYQTRLFAAQQGVGYVAPPMKRQRQPIGQEFMDKLKKDGRATQQINNA